MKKTLACFFALAFVFSAVFFVRAEDSSALDLRQELQFSTQGKGVAFSKMVDSNHSTYSSFGEGTSFHLHCDTPIASLYLEFDRIPGEWFLTDNASGKEFTCGKDSFLHEYVDVKGIFGAACTDLTVTFVQKGAIAELFAYTQGELPDTVQVWKKAEGACDVMLFATHSDDDQLFFAGLLPDFVARGMQVQVSYFANHWNTHDRPHELLNGLWHCGVTRYPVISAFPDAYSESISGAQSNLRSAGFDREEVVSYQTELLRKFRPMLVVGHDINGEYGHGQHRYNTDTLIEALSLANDEDFISSENLPLWNVPRCFLHLYEVNSVVCEYDIPLSFFGGKTAFQVSKEAFGYHKSQHWTWFADWIDVDRASEIRSYSPCEFGLYFAADGNYTVESDLFYNLKTHEQIAKEEELKKQAEEEKNKQEAREDLDSLDEGIKELEEYLEKTQSSLDTLSTISVLVLAVLLLLSAVLLIVWRKKRRNTHLEDEK